ncbi:MAG: Type III secretory pathway, component EscV [uncultured bacterium]|nr:MAG: Type III secretory pathway, component EscV [uncultured bacterium]
MSFAFLSFMTTQTSHTTIELPSVKWTNLALVLFIVSIFATLVIPLPPGLLDFLILLNTAASLTLLMQALYTTKAIKMASFPSLILITTLFRLGLNIASTRLILSEGNPGHIIAALGQLATQGNLVIGLILFVILTIIQFIIVTKGSERVAEVAARFTLDAMPGKQMSIDADLRAGMITQMEAKELRENLHRESKFYGAMDGAMKFVKGDAIACILIIFINLLGGFYTGVVHQGLTMAESATLYSSLTIGDGLVSQIASILVALTAGFLITRVSDERNPQSLGMDISQQIFGEPQVYFIVSFFILLLGFLPGLNFSTFFIISLLFATTGIAILIIKKNGLLKKVCVDTLKISDSEQTAGLVVPLLIEVGPQLYEIFKTSHEWLNCFNVLYPKLRTYLSQEMGLEYPELKIKINPLYQGHSRYTIRIFEIPVESGHITSDHCCVVNPSHENSMIKSCESFINTSHGTPLGLWQKSEQAHLRSKGLNAYSAQELFIRHLAKVLKKNSAEFIDIQHTRNILTNTEQYYPELVREVIPRMLSLQKLTDILKRLVEEGIPIRDMRLILQSLAFNQPDNKDPVYLTEQVRIGLRKMISSLYTTNRTLYTYQLSPQLEDEIRASIQRNGSECYIALPPRRIEYILSALHNTLTASTHEKPSVLTQVDIRRYVKKIIDNYLPELPVVSFQELDSNIVIAPLGIIS